MARSIVSYKCYTLAVEYLVKKPLNEQEKATLSQFSPLVAHLLFYRGMSGAKNSTKSLENNDLTISDADKFINPDYDRDTNDPFMLKDAEKAAKRIIRAISSGEKIAIYADYDADGIPGAAIFHDFFKRIGFMNFIVYIPHRHNEGFGLNVDAVEQLAKEGAKLLITVDCGISDFEPVARANDLEMEIIITDHHEPPDKLPPAFAIIDQKQIGCTYPDKNLCGSGVAYKLIQAILKIDRLGLAVGHEKWLLDLVGIATLSDMVPLVGENRVFAKFGLDVLRKSQRKGLKQLLDHLRIAQAYLSEDDITFMITPRINAASRMGVPMDAFNLLAADNDEDARKSAEHLDHINNERKGVVAALVKEIKKILRERHSDGVIPAAIVLGNPDWRPSLLGLAANSCAEEFGRPVFLWGRDGDNLIKGSCRSEGKSNVVEIMRAVPAGVFTQLGGHKYSGGFAVADEQIHFIEKHLIEATERINASVHKEGLVEPLAGGKEGTAMGELDIPDESLVDAELSLDSVNWDIYNDIAQLAPFGMGNPKPTFLIKNIVLSSVRIFGKGNEHVELVLKQTNGKRLSAIAFFGAVTEWAIILKDKATANPVNSLASMQSLTNSPATGLNIRCDIVASMEKSMFRGRPELRLRIVDVMIRN